MTAGVITIPDVLPIDGIRLGAVAAGIRYSDRLDLALFEIAHNSNVACVFTQNRFCAAPVVLAREHWQTTAPRYLIINTGSANAGTGADGLDRARAVCRELANITGVVETEVLPFSTGVIAEKLPADKIINALDDLERSLSVDGWLQVAQAIKTTDTVAKVETVCFEIAGQKVTISGMCKGAGMIRPDMATLLSFVATDAALDKPTLQLMLNAAVAKSFNRITIDGDTSTNDACVLIATGKSASVSSKSDQEIFVKNLIELMQSLAQKMVRDGEGASKFITINVNSGENSDECLSVAYTVAHSPLVKTAMFASDPNWGRILAAIGRSEVKNLDITKVNVSIGDVIICQQGEIAPSYTEDAGQQVMQQIDIIINIDLGRGNINGTIWTSDLSYDYVKINTGYRS